MIFTFSIVLYIFMYFHFTNYHPFISAFVQCKSCLIFVTPWTAARQASLSFTKFTQTHVHWVSDGIQSSHPLLPLLLLPSTFPSIRVFSSELALHIRWPKYWSFSISPYNGYSGLISFRIDWFDLFAIEGTLKSLLQHHNLKASILWHSAFFMVQLSHPHMTTSKTVPLTIWTFVSKVISLLFNTLFTFVIAFLPRSRRLLISWLRLLSWAPFWSPRK